MLPILLIVETLMVYVDWCAAERSVREFRPEEK